MRETTSVNEIRTAIRELSARAELARKEGRPDDAAELEQRIQRYREDSANGRDGVRRGGLSAQSTECAAVKHDRRHVGCTVISLTRRITIV